MSYVLAIIDMQPTFCSGNNRNLMKHCVAEIQRAKKTHSHIIVVEYGKQNTHDTLIKHLVGYSRLHFVEKNRTDGSKHIIACMNRYNIRHKTMRVVGVYTDYCVRETVLSLLDACDMSIKVVAKACYTPYAGKQMQTLMEFSRYRRIEVV